MAEVGVGWLCGVEQEGSRWVARIRHAISGDTGAGTGPSIAEVGKSTAGHQRVSDVSNESSVWLGTG